MSDARRSPFDRRRAIAGRVLATIAVARRLPTFEDLGRDLRDLSRTEVADAIDELVRRGRVVVVEFPSALHPLLDPPTVCYRSVALQDGLSLETKAGA